MSPELNAVLHAALSLSNDDRARLADSLLDSLDAIEDAGAEAAWAAEVERRSREYDEGKVSPIRWADVRDAVRKQFASDG